jgi:hypothetical protein
MSLSISSNNPGANKPDNSAPAPSRNRAWWMTAFRIFRWATYIGSAVTLLLLFHKTDPPFVQAATPAAAARVDQKFADVVESLSRGQAATVRLDEPEVNSYLATHLNLEGASALATANQTESQSPNHAESQANDLPSQQDIARARSSVRDVRIQLVEDRVKTYILFDMHGKDMTLELEGRLSTSGGYIQFEPITGRIGSLRIPPSALQTAVHRMMESPGNRETLRLPPNISDLHVANGEVVVTYQ